MQRWLSILLGVAAVALAVAVVVRTMSEKPVAEHAPRAEHAADAGVKPADAGPRPADAGKKPASADAEDPFAVLGGDVAAAPGSLGRFPDGRPVPPLPEGSPKHVRLGVVLMTFAGAQGAPPNARPKKDALELATKLASDAKTDFHAAVIRGDSGSSDDIGRMPRGILEPAVEYTVFTMPVGGVSDPIETPRGYWIAKRSE
jgi:hypothetical protein